MTTLNLQGMFRNATNIVTFKAGETILVEGQPGEYMYVIKEGEVGIYVRGKLVETAGAGEVIGEMSLIDNEPHSATVIAKTDVKLVPINQTQFTYLLHETPYFAIVVMHIMADRLRRQHQ